MAKYYKTLSEIVAQLKLCNYQTSDGLHHLEMNAAFIALENMSIEESVKEAWVVCTSCLLTHRQVDRCGKCAGSYCNGTEYILLTILPKGQYPLINFKALKLLKDGNTNSNSSNPISCNGADSGNY